MNFGLIYHINHVYDDLKTQKIAKNEKIGDVSTLEDGAAVSEIQSAFQELQKNIKDQKNN